MKKKLILICMIVCLLATICSPAYANLPENSIVPMADYHSSSKALLVISSKGIAESTGKIVGIPGVTTKTTVHLYLQRIENGEWIDVDDWIASNETVSTTITKTRAVDKGYTYRTKASCYAYSGKKYERVISYSSEIKY